MERPVLGFTVCLSLCLGVWMAFPAWAEDAPRMGIEELVDLLPRGGVVVIDTRRQSDFGADEGTVAGALRGDPSDVGSWAPHIDREKIVVVFCS